MGPAKHSSQTGLPELNHCEFLERLNQSIVRNIAWRVVRRTIILPTMLDLMTSQIISDVIHLDVLIVSN